MSVMGTVVHYLYTDLQHMSRRFSTRGLVVFPLLVMGSGITPAHAQFTVPVISTASTGARPVTAEEARYHVLTTRVELESAVSYRDAHYPIDSMLQVVSGTGAEWLTRLRAQPVAG